MDFITHLLMRFLKYCEFVSQHYLSSERVLHFYCERMRSKDENFIDIGRCLRSCARVLGCAKRIFNSISKKIWTVIWFWSIFLRLNSSFLSFFLSRHGAFVYASAMRAILFMYVHFYFFCCFCRPVRYCFSWPYHTSKQIAGKRTIAIDVVERANGKMI